MYRIESVVLYLLTACLLIALISSCVPNTNLPNTASPTGNVLFPRKVIALVSDVDSETKMRAAAAAQGYQELVADDLRALGLTMLTFEMPLGVTGASAIKILEDAVPGSVVGINHVYRVQQTASATDPLDYASAMMRWPDNGCRAQSPIGMIDTGVNAAAPALASARVITRQFFDGTPGQKAHGTDIATVLADTTRLRNVTLYAANVFGQQEELGLVAGADALVKALDWMAGNDVKFVNLALAGPYNKLLDLAVEKSVSDGMILVAAVGNDGPNVAPRYPAGFANVIAVTAVDVNQNIYRNAVRGPHVDVAAPGVDILVNSGTTKRFVSGTSIATPFVTARLASDRSLANTTAVAKVRARLASTSADLGARGRDPKFGHGLVLAEGVCGN